MSCQAHVIPFLGIALSKVLLFFFCFAKYTISLKKQVGCFNHRVVTTVADKLKRPGYERFALVLENNCMHKANQ